MEHGTRSSTHTTPVACRSAITGSFTATPDTSTETQELGTTEDSTGIRGVSRAHFGQPDRVLLLRERNPRYDQSSATEATRGRRQRNYVPGFLIDVITGHWHRLHLDGFEASSRCYTTNCIQKTAGPRTKVTGHGIIISPPLMELRASYGSIETFAPVALRAARTRSTLEIGLCGNTRARGRRYFLFETRLGSTRCGNAFARPADFLVSFTALPAFADRLLDGVRIFQTRNNRWKISLGLQPLIARAERNGQDGRKFAEEEPSTEVIQSRRPPPPPLSR
ncbi:unnamed protein product [Xylocopa violacea]|uniref:Uncharacterized protein n=1 Tax=Xylocopa violacea TaxID=135666 RepID=A0ABP1PF37_XYLVO